MKKIFFICLFLLFSILVKSQANFNNGDLRNIYNQLKVNNDSLTGRDFSTSAKQDTGNATLSTIAGKDFSTSAKQDTGNGSLSTIAGKDFSTSAKQDIGNGSLSTIAGKDFATQTTLANIYSNAYYIKGNEVSGYTSALVDTNRATLITAPGASKFTYLTTLIVTNSHATVGTEVELLDASTNTILFIAYASPLGGGFAVTFPTPLKNTTTNTIIKVKCMTTGANVRVSAVGFKGL